MLLSIESEEITLTIPIYPTPDYIATGVFWTAIPVIRGLGAK
jgi:hypothetical protein